MAVSSTPPIAIQIRDATKDDIPAISHVGASVFAATFAHSMPKRDLDQYLADAYSVKSISKDFESADDDIIVAVDEHSEVVGFAQLTCNTSEPCLSDKENFCELQRLYVHSGHHGRGIGSSLMRKIDEMARTQGFRGIWIGVWEEHVNAHRLYQRMGFEKAGEGKEFRVGETVQRDWIMWKDL